MSEPNKNSREVVTALRNMNHQDFAGWGLAQFAYLKPVMANGMQAWGVFSADGTQIGIAPTRVAAGFAVRDHDLEPLDTH